MAVPDHRAMEGMEVVETVMRPPRTDGHQAVLISSLKTQSKKSQNRILSEVQKLRTEQRAVHSQPQAGPQMEAPAPRPLLLGKSVWILPVPSFDAVHPFLLI